MLSCMELGSFNRRHLDDSSGLPLLEPFTTTTARRLGFTLHQLRWLVKQGQLWHPIKGVYVNAGLPDTTGLRCEALALVVPGDCVVVDRHAGWLLGAEMVLAPNEHLSAQPISMFRPAGMGRLRNDLADSGERNLRPDDITEVHGLRVTTHLRTAWDLGRVRSPDKAIAGMDAVMALGAFSRAEFLDGIERFRGMRWMTTLRTIGPLSDGRAQSPGESVLRLRWIQTHLPTPQPQLEVWRDGILLAILDIANEDLRYAAEYDGAEWHSTPAQTAHDLVRREDVSHEAWLIDTFVGADLFGPHAQAEARLRAGAAQARRLQGRDAG